ncbi:MAG: hypothetical protein ISN29_03590 [Gammaproteobacteria bacterium AqS3]|nr:hypothetical protein [Gammaproteobacteria bacterium AqS3]
MFARFGIPAPAFGRFIDPLHPVLSITAGMLRLSPRTFIPLNGRARNPLVLDALVR